MSIYFNQPWKHLLGRPFSDPSSCWTGRAVFLLGSLRGARLHGIRTQDPAKPPDPSFQGGGRGRAESPRPPPVLLLGVRRRRQHQVPGRADPTGQERRREEPTLQDHPMDNLRPLLPPIHVRVAHDMAQPISLSAPDRALKFDPHSRGSGLAPGFLLSHSRQACSAGPRRGPAPTPEPPPPTAWNSDAAAGVFVTLAPVLSNENRTREHFPGVGGGQLPLPLPLPAAWLPSSPTQR